METGARIAIGLMRARLQAMALVSPGWAARSALRLFLTPFARRDPRMPDIFRKAEHLRYRSGETMVQAYRWNHPSPRRFLILHGFASCAFKFEAYVMPMVRQGFEVVAIDAPAHGRSEGRRVALTDYMRAIGDAELARQQRLQRRIRFAVLRRGADAGLHVSLARGVRRHPVDPVGAARGREAHGEPGQRQLIGIQVLSANSRNVSPRMRTIGEKSTPATGGMTFRIGRSSGSVNCCVTDQTWFTNGLRRLTTSKAMSQPSTAFTISTITIS